MVQRTFRIIGRWLVHVIVLWCVPIGFARAVDAQATRTTTPEQVLTVLREGSPSEVSETAKKMQFVVPRWWSWKQTEDRPCLTYDDLKLDYVPLDGTSPKAVLQAWSLDFGMMFLAVFVRNGDSWDRLDTIVLSARRARPVVTFKALINPDINEIVVQGSEAAYGTGIFQTDFMILGLIDNRLRIVMDEPEHLHLAIPTPRETPDGNTDQAQDSEFAFEKRRQESPSLFSIIEKQTIRDHKTKLVRYRAFSWNPELREFQSGPVDR